MKINIKFMSLLLIVFLLSLTFVSAADSDAQMPVDENNETNINKDPTTTDYNFTTADTPDSNVIQITSQTFHDLKSEINLAEKGSTLVLLDDCAYDEGFSNEGIQIKKQLTIDGNGHKIDGKNSSRIFYLDADNIVLKNITFYDGNSFAAGGALLIRGSNTTIENCTFENNKAKYGGAIYIDEHSKINPTQEISRITLKNSTFISNFATNGGGAIYGISKENLIVNCCFETNKANTLLGGAVLLHNNNSRVINNTFKGNFALKDGGALALQYSINHLVDSNVFIGNTGLYGGALNIYHAGSVNVTNNLFDSNIATGLGGAARFSITITSTASIIFNNTLKNNTADLGGGAIYCDSDNAQFLQNEFTNNTVTSVSGGALNLHGINNTISNNIMNKNTASFKGGAISIVGDSNKIIFNDMTNNSAGGGGALYIIGSNSTIMNNSIKNNNATTYGGAIQISGDRTIIGNNAIISNTANRWGGAIYYGGNNAQIMENNFMANKANTESGGTIYLEGNESCLYSNIIKNTHAKRAGAIYIKGKLSKITNNTIINSTAEIIGAIQITGISATVENMRIVNASAAGAEIIIAPLDKTSEYGAVTILLPGDAGGKVSLTINGKDSDYIIGNGKVVSIPQLEERNYTLTITYPCDSVNPIITASNVKVTYGIGAYYTIKVKSDGKPANKAKIIIIVNGKTFKTLTATNGIAKFKVTDAPGTYRMSITALGKTITRTLTVKHLVTLKTLTLKKSAAKLTLQATLSKVNGKYLKNKQITFKINGKKVATAKTNSKGIAKISIKTPNVVKKLNVGKKATYQATYLKDTVKKTTTVKK